MDSENILIRTITKKAKWTNKPRKKHIAKIGVTTYCNQTIDVFDNYTGKLTDITCKTCLSKHKKRYLENERTGK